MQPANRLQIDNQRIIEFCRRWKITEFALFGSILREDFLPESDIDVLVTFDPSAHWSLFDLVDMKGELEHIFGRRIDLVEKRALRNPFRKREILRTMQVMYAV